MNKKIFLCAINNISSGNCSEDCKFCTQSAKNNIDIERYKYKDISQIVAEAALATKNKAIGYCLVTSGKGLNDKTLEFVIKAAHEVKLNFPNLSLIGCNGTATLDQLIELKKAGIDNYNHNLETSREFYPTITTTHSWEERFETALNAKKAGLKLCSGGIFGLGESDQDRASLIASLKELDPMSIPINFFISNPNLPIKGDKINIEVALDIINTIAQNIPNAMLMVAGGREQIFTNHEKALYTSKASAIVIGDYLTTAGESAKKDLEMIQSLGLELANNCHE